MSVRQIIDSFRRWQHSGEPMVLATVYETLGSTYSKAGQRILIAANGDYQGLVSGGCLEGDLAERASKVLATGVPLAVTYDMRDEADALWGLGVGCNGLIRVFLQTLSTDRGFEPFASVVATLEGTVPAGVALVVTSADPTLPIGATLICNERMRSSWQLDERGVERLIPGCASALAAGEPRLERGADGLEILFAPLRPIPHLLVLGAGLDAVPLVAMARELGWLVSIADHRPAYLEGERFAAADRVELVRPGALADTFDLGLFDAILVMSHHLVTDRQYLGEIAHAPARYLGVLGPGARRERLLEDLGEVGATLRLRLRGPVGLDIGADSPESIALSVLAEIHAAFASVAGAGAGD